MSLFGKSRTEKAKDRLKQFDVNVDISKLKDTRWPRRDEQESSSAGFVAGLFVGALIGIVLALLFRKKRGSDVVDQFAQRAEAFRETASEKLHHVRSDTAENESWSASSRNDDVAIEREVNESPDLVEAGKERVDDPTDSVVGAAEEVGEADVQVAGEAQHRSSQ